jgi:hypothetical protein
MPVQIGELEMTVDSAPATGASATAASPPPPLPPADELWRAAMVSQRATEWHARWAAHDRDDER